MEGSKKCDEGLRAHRLPMDELLIGATFGKILRLILYSVVEEDYTTPNNASLR
jgi:hypothetical protein